MDDFERNSLLTVTQVLVKIRRMANEPKPDVEGIAALANSVHNLPRLVAEGGLTNSTFLMEFAEHELARAQALLSSEPITTERRIPKYRRHWWSVWLAIVVGGLVAMPIEPPDGLFGKVACLIVFIAAFGTILVLAARLER